MADRATGPTARDSTTRGAPAVRRTLLHRIAWILLLVLVGLFALNHFGGMFYIAQSTDERQMFELFGWVHVIGFVVLLIPYRRLELWAWIVTWASILPVALVPVFTGFDALGITYLVTALVMAAAQFVTLPAFLQARAG
jgi:hypothetical protein